MLMQIGYGKLEADMVAQKLAALLPHDTLKPGALTATLPTVPQSIADLPKPRISSNKGTKKAEEGVRVQGMEGIAIRLAKCCQPLPGQSIIGFVSRGHGVTVHSSSCEWALTTDPARRVECSWNTTDAMALSVRLRILTHDKPGVLASVTKLVASSGLNIIGAEVQTTPDKRGLIILRIRVGNITELRDIHQKLEATEGVICVDRLTG
jgi:GTP pyrophosphokinase